MEATAEAEAMRFWSFFWEEASRLIEEASEVLGRHLREGPLSLRNLSREPWHGAAELRVGRTVLRVESPFVCLRPGPRETRLAELFGKTTPLARVFVYRETRSLEPRLLAWIAADPVRGEWTSSQPDLGPVRMTDAAAFESFLWSLLIDSV